MAKNKDKVHEFFESVGSSAALKILKKYSENLGERIEGFAMQIEQKVVKMFFASATMIFGGAFIFIALPFLMQQYLSLTFGWSFLVIGLVLIIIAMIAKSRAKKQKISF